MYKKNIQKLTVFCEGLLLDFEDGCEERPNLSGNGKISYVDLQGLPDYGLKKKKKKAHLLGLGEPTRNRHSLGETNEKKTAFRLLQNQ